MKHVSVCALLLALFSGAAPAQAHAQAHAQARAQSDAFPSGNDFTVTLVTFGQGEEVFERFGHNALWFHDVSTGQDVAYHWGLFSFTEPGFLLRFLTGDTRYWMGGMSARALIEMERNAGRPITLQQLNLSRAQVAALRQYVLVNSTDENKYYRYDYFGDNCSTRLRDALDHAVGGALKRATESVGTSLSYRRESIRLTDGAVQTGIDIALGRPADAPLTEWQSFFIPMRLRDAARLIRIANAAGDSVPLVAREIPVPPPQGNRRIEPTASPRLAYKLGSLGLLLAVLVIGLRIMMESRRSAAWGLALFGSGWSLFSGALGLILLLAWMATRHVYWARNENVLLFTPLSLALIMLIPASILSSRYVRAARMTGALVAVFSIIALLFALIPGGQENRAIAAMVVPVHLALAWALALPHRTATSAARTA